MKKIIMGLIVFVSMSSFASEEFEEFGVGSLNVNSENQAIQYGEGDAWARALNRCRKDSDISLPLRKSELRIDKKGLKHLNKIIVEITFSCS